ncbi:branched-chain-amino-acid transaminase [candidate division WOR-1 bacterium RIFOXYB2_FULL_48_7]|uniref:Branched-chain-amino-acid aminotransferase n=1 Tax=candidate division WOR-1 bacterium RIFOXYB2_FULL_48_7 TaxID=1802583 RepID=A0A1F4T9X2_UNCSA|nr:MAG: branched-chain-amino-acid transaminase [candidate division WOR-1 bacterium RIFOXYB2_FULL_48_7]
MRYAFFQGNIVPFNDAKISIMNHAFNYGTGVFEGIRAYWNETQNQLFLLKAREHFERLQRSAWSLKMNLKYSVPEMIELTLQLLKKNDYKQDVYIRPLAYKSADKIGLGLVGIPDDFCIFVAPFGVYLDISKGIKVCVSSWCRIGASSAPLGSKITGAYFNSSLAKSEALEKGFDEAILLSPDGSVAEGSGENLFIIKHGKLITPPLTEIILPGITRETIINLAKNELGMVVEERFVRRDELCQADELFFCGTGAEITPIIQIDETIINEGQLGTVTKKLQAVYFQAAHGDNPKYADWVIPVF